MRTLIAILLMAAPLAASAQTRSRAPKTEPPPHAQHLDIDDDEVVEGGTARGDGDIISATVHGRQTSLIKIWADFKAEMLRTALRL